MDYKYENTIRKRDIFVFFSSLFLVGVVMCWHIIFCSVVKKVNICWFALLVNLKDAKKIKAKIKQDVELPFDRHPYVTR